MKILRLNEIVPPLSIEIQKPVWLMLEYFTSGRYKIDYDVKLSNGDCLQREFVWTEHQKRELIMSMLKGIFLPDIVAICDFSDVSKIHKIIDGKQRLSTIISFMKDEFPIFHNGNQYFFSQFERNAQYKIERPNGLNIQLIWFDPMNPYTDAD